MNVLSVNVGLPKEVEWNGQTVLTGIFKDPTEAPVHIKGTQLEGDGQADLKHHGGENKAVYAYPIEHYPFWEQMLEKPIAEHGAFGENLTIQGLLETDTRIGDIWQIGTAQLMVAQPRIPCFKLGIRLQNNLMPKYFLQERRNGIYFKVVKEGTVQKGDTLQLVQRSAYDVTLQQIADCYVNPEPMMIDKILAIPFLPDVLRTKFEKELSKLG